MEVSTELLLLRYLANCGDSAEMCDIAEAVGRDRPREHETGPPNYETMWEHHRTRIGKECDDACEESMSVGHLRYKCSEYHSSVGSNEVADVMCREMLPCTQVSSCEFSPVGALMRGLRFPVVEVFRFRCVRVC